MEYLLAISVAFGIISILLGLGAKRLQRSATGSQGELFSEAVIAINELDSLLSDANYQGLVEYLESHDSVGESSASKNLAGRFAKCLIVEHLIDQGLQADIEEIGIFEEVDGELAFEISSSETVVCFPGYPQLHSFTILVRLDLVQSGNLFLIDIANAWERWDSGYKPQDIVEAQKVNSEYVDNVRKWSSGNLRDGLIYGLYDEDSLVSDPKRPLYAGGSSYYFSNLIYPSNQKGFSPCATCGSDQLFCSEEVCERAYFESSTGIDCSLEVRGLQFEDSGKKPFVGLGIIVCELEQEEIWLALQDRIPTIKGSLKLQNSSIDGKTYLSLGGRYLGDKLSASQVTKEDFEELFDVQVTHARMQPDDYLVVAWQTAFEVAESTCFVFTLLRAQPKALVLQVLAE